MPQIFKSNDDGRVVERVYTGDLKSPGVYPTRVQIPPRLNDHIYTLLYELYHQPATISRGFKCKERLLYSFAINPKDCILHLPGRPFNYNYFAAELYWYLTKSFKADFIEKYASLWKQIKNAEGEVNSNYGYYVLNQLPYVLDCFLKDKYTRQAVIVIHNELHRSKNPKDIICCMYILFWIRDNKLNMKVQMRSNDIFYGLTYDAPFFSLIQQNIYLLLRNVYPELKLGTYYHFTDNIHYYVDRHEKLVQTILSQKAILEYYQLELFSPITNFDGAVVCNISFDSSEDFLSTLPLRITKVNNDD